MGQMRLTTDSFIIDRFYDRLPWPRRWSIVLIGVIFLLIPLALAWLSDVAGLFLTMGLSAFRVFFPAIVITYILIVVELLQRTREKVALSLRPLLQIDDETFVAAVRRFCRPNPVGELVGFVLGVIFFVAIVGPPPLARVEYRSLCDVALLLRSQHDHARRHRLERLRRHRHFQVDQYAPASANRGRYL